MSAAPPHTPQIAEIAPLVDNALQRRIARAVVRLGAGRR